MNKHIRKIERKTDAWCHKAWSHNPQFYQSCISDRNSNHVWYDEKWREQFTELIIRECAALAWNEPGSILAHFGVKP